MKRFYYLIVIVMSLLPVSAIAQLSVIDGPVICDVTPKSFCVAWVTDAPADPDLIVYGFGGQDISDSVDHTPFAGMEGEILSTYAKDAGVMRVRVSGLTPDAQYLVRTVSKTDNETLMIPDLPGLSVHTAASSEVNAPDFAFLSNDITGFAVLKPGMRYAARGALVMAYVEGAAWPVSAYVGNGSNAGDSETGLTVIDLNNLYDPDGKSFDLTEVTVMRLVVFRGFGVQGEKLFFCRNLPADSGEGGFTRLARGFRSDFNCDGTVDLVDASLFIRGWGQDVDGSRYNADLDLDSSGMIDATDSEQFRLDFRLTAPFPDGK